MGLEWLEPWKSGPSKDPGGSAEEKPEPAPPWKRSRGPFGMNPPASSKCVDDERAEYDKNKEAVSDKSEPGKGGLRNMEGFGWKFQIDRDGPSCEEDAGHGQAQEHGHENDHFGKSLLHGVFFVDSK